MIIHFAIQISNFMFDEKFYKRTKELNDITKDLVNLFGRIFLLIG